MTITDRQVSAIMAHTAMRRMWGYLFVMRKHLFNQGDECVFMIDYIKCLPRHKAGTVSFGRN